MGKILFRGKRVENSKWLQGQVYKTNDMCFITDSKNVNLNTHKVAWFEVDPKTVCQFIGLTDNNGVKIFEGDILRIKGIMGEHGEYKYDCLFCVRKIDFEGIEIAFISLTNKLPDSTDNSYPIRNTLGSKIGGITCINGSEFKYPKIAISDCVSKTQFPFERYIRTMHATTDISVYGNIYDNKELLTQ